MNLEKQNKYHKIFAEALGIKESDLKKDIKYNEIPEWDSIGHMTLISALEENFKINIDTDDIVDFSSYEVGKKILLKYLDK